MSFWRSSASDRAWRISFDPNAPLKLEMISAWVFHPAPSVTVTSELALIWSMVGTAVNWYEPVRSPLSSAVANVLLSAIATKSICLTSGFTDGSQ